MNEQCRKLKKTVEQDVVIYKIGGPSLAANFNCSFVQVINF